MKKNTIIKLLLIISIILIPIGCYRQVCEELSENEINEILSEIVASDQLVEDSVLRYFTELSSENNNMISPADLYQMIQNKEDIFILDIRREEDYRRGHIENAHNIWWFDVGRNLGSLPKDKRIVITCYSGQAGGQVTGVLKVMGYDIRSLSGGMNNGWLRQELPIVTP